MDFEFTKFKSTSLVLISGAMEQNSEQSAIKLEGNPLTIHSNGTLIPTTKHDITSLILIIKKVFKNRQDKLLPILKQLDICMESTINNLNSGTILKYINKNNNKPIIVTWNGHTDKTILNTLGINCTILNLTCYDENNDKIFFLKLANFNNNKLINSKCIGKINKNGRSLNLNETHSKVCKLNHNQTYVHDPVTDVKFTKCVYSYLNKDTENNIII